MAWDFPSKYFELVNIIYTSKFVFKVLLTVLFNGSLIAY